MMDGLFELVEACQCDDQPHCAILDMLSRGSPAQHQPRYKPQITKPRGQADGPGQGSASHIDLMAWMRSVQVHHGAH